MVGEIRDIETAQIAIRASITGHLVLSTMHTQDTASTISRLLDMDVEPHMLSSALTGIVAQRLIRGICRSCEESYEASHEEKLLLGIEDEKHLILHRGRGCQNCGNTGYKDRFAIYETMPVYREIRDLIHRKASTDEIRDRACQKYGLVTLKESLVHLVLKGKTTIEELRKVSFNVED
jgi:type IV pilus assembly protein PilB